MIIGITRKLQFNRKTIHLCFTHTILKLTLVIFLGLRITTLKELGKINPATVDHKHNCAQNI